MSSATVFDGPSLTTWLIRLSVLSAIAYLSARFSLLPTSLLGIVATISCVTPLALSWLLTITENVPEPYLDEVFHVPQAQVYCEGRYLEWDDKITTPPGLYISTILFNRLLALPCSVYSLRAFNVFVVSCVSVLVLICRAHLTRVPAKSGGAREIPETSVRDIVTGINVALFPVLFFFSGLYYTDPASTLAVLLAYANHLARVEAQGPSLLNDVYSLTLGILALGFRQTNVFWVVVYMGGLEVVHAVKTLNPEPVKTPKFRILSKLVQFYAWRYSLGDIHDPPLNLAQPIDIVVCVASIGIAAVCNLPMVLRRFLWPHGAILAAFAAFVAWNGGVVLGDKSNHIATLHLAQMLYIWPFFAFFSAPLFALQPLSRAMTAYRALTSQSFISQLSSSHLATTALVSCGALAVALCIVRFNTIIHPFTLADNRHYVFYVFRYSILRAWWIRYALAPVYVVCAWMCWGVLQGLEVSDTAQEKWIRSPFTAASPSTSLSGHSGTVNKASAQGSRTAEAGPTSPPTSTVLLLLLTTTLSLMTAPLVEPRYFILPWLFWRLQVPATSMPSLFSSPSQTSAASGGTGRLKGPRQGDGSGSRYLPILFLETAWFLLINAATMYVFVTRPFYWRAPDGTLQDEGRVQRFMW
ncbi:DIE2/ALG10 family-domain-containing protein [Nemania sp. NC0429]|nr:DIE2/ALG10 family-domain-containing protein [Nemania sp. NC0429]